MNRAGGSGRGPVPVRAVPPEIEYHRVLAANERQLGRGILAIVLLVGGMLVFGSILTGVASLIDQQRGAGPAPGGSTYTPMFHAAALASVALLIPWSMLIQRRLYGVRGASLHSVVSRFRWDLFGRAVILIGPAWVATAVVSDYLVPEEQTVWSRIDLLWLLAVTFVLTPLQAAGEEYGLRGLVFRVAGSWARGPRTALVLGVLVSSVVFAVMHLSSDPWLNLWYLTFGVSTALVTWRTGGIEIAIVIHALYNTVAFLVAIALRTDLGQTSDRSAGAATAAVLVPCVVLVAVAAVVWFRTRHSGPARTPTAAEGTTPAGTAVPRSDARLVP